MAQTVVPWIPLWAYEAWVSRGVDWLVMSEDLPTRRQPRHGRRRRPHPAALPAEQPAGAPAARRGTKRILRRLGFWLVVTHSHGTQEHDAPVRHAVLRHRSARVGARSVLPHPRHRESLRRGRVVLPLVGGRESRPDHRRAGARVADHIKETETYESAVVQPRRHHGVELQPGGAVLLGCLRLPARRRRRHAARPRPRRSSASTAAPPAARSAGFACPAARCSRSSHSSRSCRQDRSPGTASG